MRVLVRGGVNNESHGERVVRGWTMRVLVRGGGVNNESLGERGWTMRVKVRGW